MKKLFIFLLGEMAMMPVNVMAQSEGGGDNNAEPGIWRSPAQNPYAYIILRMKSVWRNVL